MNKPSKAGLAARADRLRALHHAEEPLILPNAWDAASARIFETAGFPAIATTSAGVAFSLGYPDGQRIPPAEMFTAVGRIASVVAVPVTADLEAGYSDVTATAKAAIDAGVAGLNLEDSENGALIDVQRQTGRIRELVKTGEDSGVRLVLNARTDVFLDPAAPAGTRLDRAIERLRAYAEAGADSVFVPGVRDDDTIASLASAVHCPLNILAVAGAPPVSRLKQLGVRRVSIGSGGMRATMGLTARIAEERTGRGARLTQNKELDGPCRVPRVRRARISQELLRSGTYSSFTENALSYADANALFQFS